MTTRQRGDEYLTDYTKHFKAARDLCKEKYRGIFKIPMLAQKESTWASDQEGSNKKEYRSNKVWFTHQEDGRRLCHRLGEHLPDPYQGCATYCPSISMTKVIMISGKSNETIATKLICPQRTAIILALGMYLI